MDGEPTSVATVATSRVRRSTSNDRWMEHFDLLVEYRETNGHCEVPRLQWQGQGQKRKLLGEWVHNQRKLYKEGKLSAEWEALLESISFVWNLDTDKKRKNDNLISKQDTETKPTKKRRRTKWDEIWEENFKNLKEFREANGHCIIPSRRDSLGTWVTVQRTLCTEGRLREDRKELLEEIGFSWSVRKRKTWQDYYDDLKEYQKEHGDCNVVRSTKNNDHSSLAKWVKQQRVIFKQGLMLVDRKKLLDAIGFHLVFHHATTWEQNYQKLKDFKEEHGHFNIPRKHSDQAALSVWACNQRNTFKRGYMLSYRKGLLDSIGFSWDVNDDKWHNNYQTLISYKKENGHLIVPNIGENAVLANWASQQRETFRKGMMRKDRKQLLDAIGFVWYLHQHQGGRWQTNYYKLVDFKNKNGHLRVPRKGELCALAYWACDQRTNKDHMCKDRRELLNGIGFFGNDKELIVWTRKYKELEEFWLHHGHANVPPNDDDPLSAWAAEQRSNYEGGRMGIKKKAMLDEIGFFEDECSHEVWNRKYEELEKFWLDHGHANVPAEDPLSIWTTEQRLEYVGGRMDTKKKAMLDLLDFGSDDDMWLNKHKELKEFRRFHGHVNVPSEDPLSNWTEEQRFNHVEGRMDATKKKMLDSVGFVWEDKIWLKSYKDLEEFWLLHGHVNVPVEDDLSAWTEKQRLDRSTGRMDSKKKMLLDSLEFVWEDPDFVGYAASLVPSI